MRREDRVLAWAAVIVLAVMAFGLLWFLFVGPTDKSPYYSAQCSENCEVPWWASAAAWTCLFTFVLTVSSGFMWWETRRLAAGAEDQAKDAKASFALIHRPRLRLRYVDGPTPLNVFATTPGYEVVAYLVNVGDSDAIIESADIGASFDNGSETRRLRLLPYDQQAGTRLTIGEGIRVSAVLKDGWSGFDSAFNDKVTIYGSVDYRDNAGIHRATCFSREYESRTDR